MRDLKELLEGLIKAAEAKDRPRVLELNKLFDDLVITSTPRYNEYDNLRQSCVLCMNMLPSFYEECIKDAHERFKRIYSE